MRNILLLSAGRRVELVQNFKKALVRKSPDSKIVAADAQELAPALFFADHSVQLPRISEPNYKSALVEVLQQNEIDLVIPTIDPELPLLAALKPEIESETSAKVMIAESWVVEICNDKVLTHNHLSENGLLTPKVFTDPSDVREDDFPLILKPKAGSSSIGVHVVNSKEELEYLFPRSTDPMIQELVEGDEFTVDCFTDFEGNLISVVPRLRIATRGGEILKGKIMKDQEIVAGVKQLLNSLPMPGHSTVQCFKTSRGVEFIEVNPRFGGGAPMSIAAGANSCERLIDIMNGVSLEYSDNFQDGLTFLRFDQSISIPDRELKDGSE